MSAQRTVLDPRGPASIAAAAIDARDSISLVWNGVKHQICYLTPAQAATLLENNVRNRPLRDPLIQRYADEMRGGRWHYTASPVSFDVDGVLINGQHTLHAIVRSKMCIPVMVVRDLPRDAFWAYDIGARRTVAQQVALTGESNYAHLSSGIRMLWLYLNFGRMGPGQGPGPERTHELIQEHPGMRDAASWVNGRYKKNHPSVTTAILYLGRLANAPECDLFYEKLSTGANLDQGDPALVYREWVLNKFAGTRNRPPVDVFAAFQIKALNAALEGRAMKILRWKEDEDFPRIVGLPARLQNYREAR